MHHRLYLVYQFMANITKYRMITDANSGYRFSASPPPGKGTTVPRLSRCFSLDARESASHHTTCCLRILDLQRVEVISPVRRVASRDAIPHLHRSLEYRGQY